MEFPVEHLRIVKKTTEFQTDMNNRFVVDFGVDELCKDRHFDSRVLFLVEDGSNERLLAEMKILVKGESKG